MATYFPAAFKTAVFQTGIPSNNISLKGLREFSQDRITYKYRNSEDQNYQTQMVSEPGPLEAAFSEKHVACGLEW